MLQPTKMIEMYLNMAYIPRNTVNVKIQWKRKKLRSFVFFFFCTNIINLYIKKEKSS